MGTGSWGQPKPQMRCELEAVDRDRGIDKIGWEWLVGEGVPVFRRTCLSLQVGTGPQLSSIFVFISAHHAWFGGMWVGLPPSLGWRLGAEGRGQARSAGGKQGSCLEAHGRGKADRAEDCSLGPGWLTFSVFWKFSLGLP